MNRHAIIVAGGKGTRLNKNIPKQFLQLNGWPILMYTIKAFEKCHITLVLPAKYLVLWDELCKLHKFKIPHKIVNGGGSRFQSVKKGLASIKDDGLVAIHDGVRPLIDNTIIEESFDAAEKFGNAITTIPLKDSIRKRDENTNSSTSKNRSDYFLVQTPQTFDIKTIKKAYKVKESSLFTDDASVYEHAGHSIHTINGNEKNIKITTQEDMYIALAIKNQEFRF